MRTLHPVAGLLSAVLLGWGSIAASQEAHPPQPQLVLIETDPWLMVIGSESPEFALYDDGLAIYLGSGGYRAVRLEPDERAALLEDINLAGLAEFYEASGGVTDQPTNIFIDFREAKPVASLVYGSLAANGVRAEVPKALSLAYDRLHNFDHPRSTEWVPEKIEVMIWPYDYAPEESIYWPSEWPGLDDPSTRNRGEESYSLYVPSSQLSELRTFLRKQNARGAVEIGGKKWAVSTRYPFPSEGRWMAMDSEAN